MRIVLTQFAYLRNEGEGRLILMNHCSRTSCCLTVTKIDEHGDTDVPIFWGESANAADGVSTQTIVQNSAPLTKVFCTVVQ
jgi:hypothetical protein